ncbi:DUF397 domain-containing protein [Streptomyces sp. XM4011]|uniref:DUF397 domain-containing protein n=1 Tax=Streptomyces TaxID=1883 RepID=UPI0002EFE989|nr:MULTISPECIES: DUF397 domain-containing protein [Streptomyces]MCK1814801.1 DUF397 domain-containing protein [Streptomyces sp. XM4011]QKV69432.1 DUF397 domain-containing protein [Streptomyces harbinensis]
MRHLVWQKSSFSGSGGNGSCVELAATTTHTGVCLRESDVPAVTLTASRAATRALLTRIKTGGIALKAAP